MYERILVPIDGGVTAAQGLREAVKLAKCHGSRIRLVHVVDELPTVEPFGGSGGGEFVMAQLRDIGKSLLETSAGEARASGVPVESELIEQIGSPASSLILQAAVAFRADLIVCGTHGRTGLRRVVLGSTAEEIVRRSNTPVLLVPPGAVGAP
jgi:nucleotide-binding universal stress UspA family protein